MVECVCRYSSCRSFRLAHSVLTPSEMSCVSQVPVELSRGGADYRDAFRTPQPGKEFQVECEDLPSDGFHSLRKWPHLSTFSLNEYATVWRCLKAVSMLRASLHRFCQYILCSLQAFSQTCTMCHWERKTYLTRYRLCWGVLRLSKREPSLLATGLSRSLACDWIKV